MCHPWPRRCWPHILAHVGWLREGPSTDGTTPAEGHGTSHPLTRCHCPSPVSWTHTQEPFPAARDVLCTHRSSGWKHRTSQCRPHSGVAVDASMKSWAMGTSSDQPEAPRAEDRVPLPGAGDYTQAGLGAMPSNAVAKEKMGLSIHPCHTTQRFSRNSTSAHTGGRKLPLLMEHKLGISIIKSD